MHSIIIFGIQVMYMEFTLLKILTALARSTLAPAANSIFTTLILFFSQAINNGVVFSYMSSGTL